VVWAGVALMESETEGPATLPRGVLKMTLPATGALMGLEPPPPPLLLPPLPQPERQRSAMAARAERLVDALALRPEGTNGNLGMEVTPESKMGEFQPS